MEKPHIHRIKIIEELKKIEWNSLLDVGCASGTNLYFIHREFPDVYLAGIDIEPVNIGKYVKTLSNVHLKVADARKLPFKDNEFDIVLSDAVLMYIDEIDAVNEMKRVSKKAIIICEPHSENPKVEQNSSGVIRDYKKLFGDKLEFVYKLDEWKGSPWEKHGYIMIWKH